MKKKLAATSLLILLAIITGCAVQTAENSRTAPCQDGNCQPRDVSAMDLFSQPGNRGAAQDAETGVDDLEDVLEKGLALAEASPTHLAVRGTPAAGSTRCEWRGIARTMAQREEALRFWLDLDATDPLPSAQEAEQQLTAELLNINAAYTETVIANFQAIAQGGLSDDYQFLTCHLNYTAHEFLLGAGTTGSTITVSYDRMAEARSYQTYRAAHHAGEFGPDPLRTQGEYQDYLAEQSTQMETLLGILMEDRETVVFLAPMGAHNAIANETWLAVAQWDLQEDDDEVVHAVRYGAQEGDPEHSQTLASLQSRVTTAAAADSHADDRIANASGLQTYYREIGAYGDITPGDGSTTTFTPAQPPAPMACAQGAAVNSLNRSLIHDCQHLLDAETTLDGTATLNWDKDTAIAFWDGITTSGTPEQVTELDLSSESLDGAIPTSLGSLFELTTLDLSANSLTGPIPHELGWLHNLQTLRLTGNTLTGCIPLSLKDVATNDLSTLNLPYCQPPAPAGLQVTITGTTAGLSWDAVTGAASYRIEQRPGIGTDWNILDSAITGTTHTASGLACGTSHQFRVSALGNGTTHTAEWSEESASVTAETGPCAQEPVLTDCSTGAAVPSPADNPGLVQDCSTLLTAQPTLEGSNGDLDWSSDTPITGWEGLRVSNTTQRVTMLLLTDKGLDGAIPPILGRLQDLRRIDLDENDLTGPVPAELGSLRKLTHLYLHDNELSGAIPPELGALRQLQVLYVENNNFTGPIPVELAQMDRLRLMTLGGNEITGSIPAELGNMPKLAELILRDNALTGSIPASLADLDLARLDLSGNSLTGCIPPALNDIPANDLDLLALADCQ